MLPSFPGSGAGLCSPRAKLSLERLHAEEAPDVVGEGQDHQADDEEESDQREPLDRGEVVLAGNMTAGSAANRMQGPGGMMFMGGPPGRR